MQPEELRTGTDSLRHAYICIEIDKWAETLFVQVFFSLQFMAHFFTIAPAGHF